MNQTDPSRNHEERVIRGDWFARMSVVLAVCIEVVPIEFDLVCTGCRGGDLKLTLLGLLLAKAVFLSVIFARC